VSDLEALRLAQQVVQARADVAQEAALVAQRRLHLADDLAGQIRRQLLHRAARVVHQVVNVLQVAPFQARAEHVY